VTVSALAAFSRSLCSTQDVYATDSSATDLRCESCYSKTFNCAVCHQPVQSEYVIEANRFVHPSCSARRCGKCSGSLVGVSDVIEALDQHYHTSCFTCAKCATPINGAFQNRDGTPWCVSCHDDAATTTAANGLSDSHGACPVCAAPVTKGSGSMQVSGQHYHIACFVCSQCQRNLASGTGVGVYVQAGSLICGDCHSRGSGNAGSAGGETCGNCGQPLVGFGGYLDMGDKKVHDHCHKCTLCQRPLGGDSYTVGDSGPVCHPCGSPKCTGCGQQLGGGSHVEVGGGAYHLDCFTCASCRTPLVSDGGARYVEKNGLPHCSNCA
jgi:LIM domain